MRKSLVAFLVLVTLIAFSHSGSAQDGLFARMETSAGDIRVRLEFERAPRTVANFVGLIEGSQKAVDPSNGTIIEGGYYDGLIFHRVMPNFIIQSGSPNGLGTGGPGYRFPDEFHTELRHDRPFILSMANNGPNSNGSQFFITLAATPWLDQVHSIFGEVVEGSEVVQQINQVPTSGNNRPIEDVIIHTITIQRVGEAALAFDPTSFDLPEPNIVAAELIHDGTEFYLDIPWKRNSDYQLFDTADLSQWMARRIGIVGETLPPGPVDITTFTEGASRKFFRVVEVQYAQVVLTPTTMRSSSLTLNVTEFAGFSTQSSIVYHFNNQGGGTAQRNDESVPIDNYSYVANAPDRSTLIVPSELIQPLNLVQLVLRFISDTMGTFVGNLPTAMPHPTTMSGTFTFSRP